MPYFQFPRRPASAARKLLLIKAILSLVSYSLDKALHLLPGFQAKLFFTRDCVCDFYCWRRQNDDEMSRGFPYFWCHHEKVKHALQLAEKGDVKSIQKLQQHATRSEPHQSYRHTTDSTHELSSLVAFLSIMEASNECFICRFVLTPTEENRTICLSCTTRLYMRENMRYDISVLENFFSSSRIGTLPMLFTISLHSFSQWIILPTNSVHWASFLIDNVNDIFYLFSGEFRC